MTTLETLENNGLAELQNGEQTITIFFRTFFGTTKEFLFEQNGTPLFGCKSKQTALKKLEQLESKGFRLA